MISIIVPIYNSKRFIADCIETIKSQTIKDIEVIFIDDASTDACADLIADHQFIQTIPVKFFRSQYNRGPSESRNIGLSMATSDWIAFLDVDDLWNPNHLQSLLDCAFKSGSTFVYSDLQVIDYSSRETIYCGYPENEFVVPNDLYTGSFIMPSQVLVHRSIGLFPNWFDVDLRYGEDADCWIRLYHNGAKFQCTGIATCYYRKVEGSPSSHSSEICVSTAKRLLKYRSYNDFRQSSIYAMSATSWCQAASLSYKQNCFNAVWFVAYASILYTVSVIFRLQEVFDTMSKVSIFRFITINR